MSDLSLNIRSIVLSHQIPSLFHQTGCLHYNDFSTAQHTIYVRTQCGCGFVFERNPMRSEGISIQVVFKDFLLFFTLIFQKIKS